MLTIILLSVLLSILLIASVITNVLLYKALRNQLKRIKLYETWIVEYEKWVFDVRNLVQSTYLKMKSVHEKDIFSKDDDVGFAFSNLLHLLKQLNDRIQK